MIEASKLLDLAVNLSYELITSIIEIECLAIVLRNNDQGSPYCRMKGYPDSYFEKIKKHFFDLDSTDYVCLCGQVLNGAVDKLKDKLTEHGSYWQNRIDPVFFDELKESIQMNNTCLNERMESLALIPIKKNNRSNGLFHLADHQKDQFSEKKILKLERIGTHLSQLLLGIEEVVLKGTRHSRNILIVEDEKELNSILKRILEKFDHKCFSAMDGKQALEIIQSEKIDVVITDLEMPVMSGLDLIRIVRDKYEHYGPLIIVLSGDTNSLTPDLIRDLRISRVLQKPLDNIIQLKKVIEDLYQEIA